MAPFRVIIVGGSISGLTLANMLDQSGIDFVVLEKHAVIAPQLGAGFAIFPNGARVLNQLGCYHPLEEANEPVNHFSAIGPDGRPSGEQSDFGRYFQELFGYKMRFMDRRKVIETLYENLRDKSKIQASRTVMKILSHSDGVEVETADGSVFYGDIVVGADGVHSRVRQEMQRLGEEETPGRDLFPEEECQSRTCDYGGLFGISKAPKGIIPDEAFKCYKERRSYLCASGPGDTLYWIFMFKNESRTQGKSIPLYTEADQDRLVALHGDDIVKPGITFRDMFERKIQGAIVPLQEGVLKHCFYKRMVLLGDSWHKVNPLSGLGGNTAMMSATVLVNELNNFLGRENPLSEDSLYEAFSNYQRSRENQVRKVVVTGHQMQRMDALETRLLKFIQLKVVSTLPFENMCNMFGQMFASAVYLKHLPLPERQGAMPFTHEVTIRPKPRSGVVNWLSTFVLVAIVLFLYPLTEQETHAPSTATRSATSFTKRFGMDMDAPTSIQLYYNMSISVVTLVMCVESYRKCFFMSPLGSAPLFGIAAFFVGWQIVTPVYFALFVFSTGAAAYYYPSARAIDLATAKSLPNAYLVNYLPVMICNLASSPLSSHVWAISHATLPLTIQLIAKWHARRSSQSSMRGPALLWSDGDLEYISTVFDSLAPIVHLACHWPMAKNGAIEPRMVSLCNLFFSDKTYTGYAASALMLDALIFVFIVFILWDIRRVHAFTTISRWDIINNVTVGLVLSPAVGLALLWAKRETHWEASRQRKKPAVEV